MKNKVWALAVLTAFASIAAAENAVWNKDNDLNSWQSKANATVTFADNVLQISDIKKDQQVISPEINLNAADYNAVTAGSAEKIRCAHLYRKHGYIGS